MGYLVTKTIADASIGAAKLTETFIESSEKGAANGVATLDGSGKIPLSQTQVSMMNFNGSYNATTDTPALENTDTSVEGFVYVVDTAGSQDFGAGSISFDIGDWVYNDGSVWRKLDGVDPTNTDALVEGSVNFYYTEARFDSSLAASDSDDVSEGSVNLYHTTARARAAAVVNSTAGSETDQAPSVAAMKAYADAAAGSTNGKDFFVLVALDISNGYVDLAQSAIAASINVDVKGYPSQYEGDDYTVSIPAAVTRITFAGDLATLLAIGDKISVQFEY